MDDHTHTFVAYPAPSGYMRDTNEWVEICAHPGCMLVRSDTDQGQCIGCGGAFPTGHECGRNR